MEWSRNRIARLAGFLYLMVVLAGIFSLGYVPSEINVRGDVAGTVSNIQTFELLFRLGIVASVICYTAFLLLPLVLYKLLHQVDEVAAKLMVILAVVSVPMSFTNLLNRLDVLTLLAGDGYLQGLTTSQVHAQAGLLLSAYGNGLLVSEVFWGLWLLPFGYLVYRSGFLPRVLGVLLMLGCCGYLIDFFGRLLFPGFATTTIGGLVTVPAAMGEIGTCLWLLVIGVRGLDRPGTELRASA